MRGPQTKQHELNILAFQAVMGPRKGSSRGKGKRAPRCRVCSSPDHRLETWPGEECQGQRLFATIWGLHQASAREDVGTWETSVAKEEERESCRCTTVYSSRSLWICKAVSDHGPAVDVPEWTHEERKERTQSEMEDLATNKMRRITKWGRCGKGLRAVQPWLYSVGGRANQMGLVRARLLKKRNSARECWGMYDFLRHRVRELPG